MSGAAPSEDRQPVMDHVALASRHAWDQVIRYCYHLGAHWLGGPPMAELGGFYFCQAGLDGGAKLEFLEPLDLPGSDFVRRFLDRNGPGPHHFTFKVPHFDAALEAVGAAGYTVVGVDRTDPQWNEAFLHPKESHGVVIQLAWDGNPDDEWPPPPELPPARRDRPPTLRAVHHLVADLDAAVALFTGPLAMTEVERTEGPRGREAVVACGPWRLELAQPGDDGSRRHWLGTRPGRLHHLTLAIEEPAAVPDARPLGDGRYEIPPEANLGTRLILEAR
ncbi:MAG: VOC family protein [Acidimicrobiales bacterium]